MTEQVTRAALRLRTLGLPSLTDETGKSPPSLGWGKPLALLCYLAVRREARRDEIVDLLWREMEPDKARNTFRQALHRLRTALGEDVLPQDRELLRLVEQPSLSIDLTEFERATTSGRTAAAIALYSGDFLQDAEIGESAFDLWAEQERQRLRGQYRLLLHRAVRDASAAGEWSDAIAAARRLLAVAPFDADAANLAATTLLAAGRAAEARELLGTFAQRLDAELGVPVPPELKALTTRLQRLETADRSPRSTAAVTDFAGRESELSRLMSLWRSTAEDSGTLAIVEGDAGLGKSRLVRELAGNVRALGRALVLAARERPVGAQLPLGVFSDALRPLVRTPGIGGASRHLLAEASRLLPELRDSFDLPAITDVEDEAARLRFFEGLAAIVDAAAYEQPVLFVIEDAQRLPPSSLDLLSYFTARLAGSAVMLVVTTTPLDGTPLGPRLRALAAEHPRVEHVRLEPLTRTAAFTSVERVARDNGVSEATLARVVDQAHGNPSLLAELVRRAASGDNVGTALVSVADVARERLQRLTSAQRRYLLVAAMVGRPVSPEVVAQGAHVSLNAAGEMVEALERAGFLIVESDAIEAEPRAAALVLQNADPATKSFLAGWIAEALSARADVSASELARFHALAGQPQRAWEQARRAAFDAFALGAFGEGVQYLQAARSVAMTVEQQTELESLLAAAGSGRLRLPSRGNSAQTSTASAGGADAATEPGSRLARLVPNWRYLVGAAVATLLVAAVVRAPGTGIAATAATSADTLVVADAGDGGAVRFATGSIARGFTLSARVAAPPRVPVWADSAGDGSTAIPSPTGAYVAINAAIDGAARLLVVSADQRDTLDIPHARALGWSPDGGWLLVAGASGLQSVQLLDGARRALDTSSRRVVIEAAWSPDGSRVAWVARTGDARQAEVYVAYADGSGFQNVSRHPADDHHIAWSGDGDLLAFTSMRDGNAELYAVSVAENRVWRLTRDPAQDDRATFSNSGRLVAFESTRGGEAGVYVMPALGGDARRVGTLPDLVVVRWQGPGADYVDELRVRASGIPSPGDSVSVTAFAFGRQGDAVPALPTQWAVLDTQLAVLRDPADRTNIDRILLARRSGLARVVASVGGWRADTALLRIGEDPLTLIHANTEPSWRSAFQFLGAPMPATLGDGVRLHGDRDWESGLLSHRAIPLLPGLEVEVAFQSTSINAATAALGVSLVAPEPPAALDQAAPQFLRQAGCVWSAETRQVVCSVGREVHALPVAFGSGDSLRVRMRIESDSTVSFGVADRGRWRSSLRVVNPRQDGRAQLWIGGRATGDAVVTSLSVLLK